MNTVNSGSTPPEPRLRQLFLAALDLPDPAAREAFLDRACAADPALRAQVAALLQQHRDDSFLERPAVDRAALDHPTVKTPPPGGAAADASATGPLGSIRYFGDYELEEEIARGGMGVVYRARQKSLNRAVAVKMILGGQLATAADVKRFHVEAEAAANLKHPHIVAIHEIGEHEGRHYFSMDLIEGGNLSQAIGDAPMAATRAAGLMKTLAEAIHYAHQRGTLHRDLKPQNVLMDAEGQPHITDFGLARQLGGGSDLTQSGTVMGSPSYMPPEQATGRLAEIGPASDVYALGAILYQMLTGRVPFAGATPVDTLRQVVEKEPSSPAKLNDKVPADLETICLKCLEKKPERRYASARALAEELERFLHHEPIQARPPHPLRVAWLWLTRHPWVITGVFSALLLGLVGLAFGLGEEVSRLRWKLANPGQALPFQAKDFISNGLAGLLLLEFFLLQMLPLERFRRHRAAGAVTNRRLLKYALVGLAQVLLGLWLARRGIAMEIWFGRFSTLSVLWVVPVITNVWFGIAVLWQCVRDRRLDVHNLATDAALVSPVQLCFNRRVWLVAFGAAVLCLIELWLFAPSLRASVAGAGNQSQALALLPWSAFLLAVTIVLLVALLKSRGAGRTAYLPPLLCTTILFDIACASFLKRHEGGDWLTLLCFLLTGVLAGVLAVRSGCVEGETLWRGSFAEMGAAARRGILWRWKWRLAAGAGALIILFYGVENWRGASVWQEEKRRLETRGIRLDWRATLPKPVAPELNIERHPFMEQARTSSIPWQHEPVFKKLRIAGLSDSLPVTLDTIKKMPARPTRVRFADLEPSLRNQEPLKVIFNENDLDDALASLARIAQLKVVMDANKLPFIAPAPGRPGGFTKTKVTYNSGGEKLLADVLDELCALYALAPEHDGANGVIRIQLAVPSREELAADLGREAERLAQYVEAMQRPHRRALVRQDIMLFEYATNRHTWKDERTAFQLLISRANLHFANGDHAAARRDFDAVFRSIETELGTPTTLVAAMMRMAMAGLLSDSLHAMLAEGSLSDADLAAHQRRLAPVTLLTGYQQAMHAERQFFTEALRLVGHPLEFRDISGDYHHAITTIAQWERNDWSGNYKGSQLATWSYAAMPRGWTYQNLVTAHRIFKWDEAFDPVALRVNPAQYAQAALEAGELNLSPTTPHNFMAKRLTPSFAKALTTTAKRQTHVHMAVLACALERHRRAHGAYPELLTALVPPFVEKLPHDLFDGQPLRYRRTSDSGFLLYSIGWNNRDDGGQTSRRDGKPAWAEDGGDWVWGTGM